MDALWRRLEVEGIFDVYVGARASAILSISHAHLELRLHSWRAARRMRRDARPWITHIGQQLRERHMELGVTLHGETIATLEADPSGRVSRLIGIDPLRLRWPALLRAATLFWRRRGETP